MSPIDETQVPEDTLPLAMGQDPFVASWIVETARQQRERDSMEDPDVEEPSPGDDDDSDEDEDEDEDDQV